MNILITILTFLVVATYNFRFISTTQLSSANSSKDLTHAQFFDQLKQMLTDNGVLSGLASIPDSKSDCDKCLQELENEGNDELTPAFPCDEWHRDTSTCILKRNVGDTVTLSVQFSPDGFGVQGPVSWRQRLHRLKKRKHEYIIRSDKPPWNMVIGAQGRELRVSPVTEMDMDGNSFSASVAKSSDKIHFKIRPLPIDMGYVYEGESLSLNIDSFVNLPVEGVHFEWSFEGRRGLPSNMRKSPLGRELRISELSLDQAGIISCEVFTNRGFLFVHKRFLITDLQPIRPSNAFNLPSSENAVLHRQSRRVKIEDEIEEAMKEMSPGTESGNEGIQVSDSDTEVDDVLTSIKRKNLLKKMFIKDFYARSSPSPEENLAAEGDDSDLNFKPFPQFDEPMNNRLSNEPYEDSNEDKSNVIPPSENNRVSVDYFVENDELKPPSNSEDQDFSMETKPNMENRQMKKITQFAQQPARENNVQPQFAQQPARENNVQPQFAQQPAPKDKSPPGITSIGRLKQKSRPEDFIAKLISSCSVDKQCSSHSTCVKTQNADGFCRCKVGFIGNGLSCWEEDMYGNKLN